MVMRHQPDVMSYPAASSSLNLQPTALFGRPATHLILITAPLRTKNAHHLRRCSTSHGFKMTSSGTASNYAIEMAVPAHLAEVRLRTDTRVGRIRAAVRERLTKEIAYWDHRAAELRGQANAGKQPRMNPDRAQGRADDLSARLKARLADLDRDQQLSALPPVVVGGALIVPAGCSRFSRSSQQRGRHL